MKKLLLLALLLGSHAAHASNGTIPCAIRWDAYYGATTGFSSVTSRTQMKLGLQAFQYRLPWFSTILNNYRVIIDGNHQSIVDQQITYASTNAHLSCWAFLYYKNDAEMNNALALYRTSSLKSSMKWTRMITLSNWTSSSNFASNFQTQLVSDFGDADYQKVLTTRPVLWVYDSATAINSWGTSDATTWVTNLRAAAATAGVGNPYIILMTSNATDLATKAQAIGADSISNYIANSLPTQLPATFAQLDTAVQTFWAAQKTAASAHSVKMVPVVHMGWHPIPMGVQPTVGWISTYPHPRYGLLHYSAEPTAAEQTSLLTAAVNYVVANPTENDSKLILIYAWNEHMEGGTMIEPEYGTGTPVLTYTNAVGAVDW